MKTKLASKKDSRQTFINMWRKLNFFVLIWNSFLIYVLHEVLQYKAKKIALSTVWPNNGDTTIISVIVLWTNAKIIRPWFGVCSTKNACHIKYIMSKDRQRKLFFNPIWTWIAEHRLFQIRLFMIGPRLLLAWMTEVIRYLRPIIKTTVYDLSARNPSFWSWWSS